MPAYGGIGFTRKSLQNIVAAGPQSAHQRSSSLTQDSVNPIYAFRF